MLLVIKYWFSTNYLAFLIKQVTEYLTNLLFLMVYSISLSFIKNSYKKQIMIYFNKYEIPGQLSSIKCI